MIAMLSQANSCLKQNSSNLYIAESIDYMDSESCIVQFYNNSLTNCWEVFLCETPNLKKKKQINFLSVILSQIS